MHLASYLFLTYGAVMTNDWPAQDDFVRDLRARAKAARVTMKQVCALAGVNESTWQRYRGGSRDAMYKQVRALALAMRELEAKESVK